MNGPARIEDKKVLIVDDDASMRALIRRMLGRMKITNMIEAEGGEQALKRLKTAPIDLVICDWNMPGMSGLELYGRARSFNPNLPFLMLTGRADPESQIAAKRAGIAAYMVKPISPVELKIKISFLLGTSA
jgi:two-component system, chemotaxis family, chemotaxis protein CheY